MSGGFPLVGSIFNMQGLGFTSGSYYCQVGLTPSTSAHTKGSYTQLTASSPSDCDLISAKIALNPNNGKQWSVDIAIGAGGSEVVIIPDLMLDGSATGFGFAAATEFQFPVFIPAGTRISARCMTDAASSGDTINFSANFGSGDFLTQGGGGVDIIGFNSATVLGTSITPGTSGTTKGSYVQLTSSTAREYIGLACHIDQQGVNSGYFDAMSFDIAIGAGGSEVILYPDFKVHDFGSQLIGSTTPFWPVPIPAGTRIAARAVQGSSAAAVARGCTVYGVF